MPVIMKRIFPCEHCCDEKEMHRRRKNMRFCASALVQSEICFIPGIDEDNIKEVLDFIDADDFKVELVCCNLIVVTGFFTKKVIFKDCMAPVRKDITVSIEVPVEIDDPEDLNVREWKVTGVEVCTGCFKLTCPDEEKEMHHREEDNDDKGHHHEENLFHKLVEKDIISVQVDHV